MVQTNTSPHDSAPEKHRADQGPQGYDVNHKEIQLLRLRSFTLGRALSDDEFLADDAQERIAALIAAMEPFVSNDSPLLRSTSPCPEPVFFFLVLHFPPILPPLD